MNRLLSILLTAIFCASASAQTIKTLGYNSTNGQVVAATNVVWTNAFGFSTNTVAASARTNLGLGATWLTNTNVTNFRTAVGLGTTDNVTFSNVNASAVVSSPYIEANEFFLGEGGIVSFEGSGGTINFEGVINFGSSAAGVRTNLGFPLAALTNTSNVTLMRALAGSTNTSHPFTGSVTVVDDVNDVATLVFSNGILVELQ